MIRLNQSCCQMAVRDWKVASLSRIARVNLNVKPRVAQLWRTTLRDPTAASCIEAFSLNQLYDFPPHVARQGGRRHPDGIEFRSRHAFLCVHRASVVCPQTAGGRDGMGAGTKRIVRCIPQDSFASPLPVSVLNPLRHDGSRGILLHRLTEWNLP